MSGTKIIRCYLILLLVYAGAMALYLWYTSPNEVPPALRGTAADPTTFMTAQQLKQSEVYSAERSGLFLLASPWEWGVYVLWLFGGGARKLQRRAERSRLPRLLHLPVYTVIVTLSVTLSWLPVRYLGYRLSQAYGISTQPFLDWLKDKGIGFALDTVVVMASAAAALWLLRRGGRWWLKLWLLSIPFTLFLMIVQPIWIDPLYDKVTRLSDPQLEMSIVQLAHQAGIPADRVYEVHMADKTNAMNAYVNGIGPTLRIVLWDTTLQKLDRDEILQVMAHEMGHYKMHHLEWSALGAIASSFVLLAIGSRFYRYTWRRWGARMGIAGPADLAALPLLLLLVSVLGFAASPLANAVSRQAEADADHYALRLLGSKGAVSLNQKMAVATLDDVNPPLLVHWLMDDHPRDMKRIHDAEVFGTNAQ